MSAHTQQSTEDPLPLAQSKHAALRLAECANDHHTRVTQIATALLAGCQNLESWMTYCDTDKGKSEASKAIRCARKLANELLTTEYQEREADLKIIESAEETEESIKCYEALGIQFPLEFDAALERVITSTKSAERRLRHFQNWLRRKPTMFIHGIPAFLYSVAGFKEKGFTYSEFKHFAESFPDWQTAEISKTRSTAAKKRHEPRGPNEASTQDEEANPIRRNFSGRDE